MQHRPPLGLFGNLIQLYSLDELIETVRALEVKQSEQTVSELSDALFAELGMKRTPQEVRDWALSVGYELGPADALPEHAIAAYNETHPDLPY